MVKTIGSHVRRNVVGYIALFVALGGTSYAATGGNFILGQPNSASSTTSLSAPVAGKKALQLTNTSTGAGATGLGLSVASGHPPFTVNSGTKVTNLNADRLDGLDSSAFLSSSDVKWAQVEPDGTLDAHSGVTAVNHLGTGSYDVSFDQDVSGCAYSATAVKTPYEIGALSDAPDTPDAVQIGISDGANNPADTGFSVEAFC
jgi:hypothetical protein